jgi:endonuclease V-like protein UPF0215 family
VVSAVIACDDGVVEKLGGGRTIVACTLWKLGVGPLRIGHLPVHIDGLDATSQLSFIISALKPRSGQPIDAVLLDSVTIAGFNVVSVKALSRICGCPVIVAYKRMPRRERILSALYSHLPDWPIRERIILYVIDRVRRLDTRLGPLYVAVEGAEYWYAKNVIESYQVYARMPEPLRFIDLYASALSRLLIQE